MNRYLTLMLVILTLAACGGPYRSPEAVTSAWLEAQVTGDCDQVCSLMTPGECLPHDCQDGRFIEVRIDETVVADTSLSDVKQVTVTGRFVHSNGWTDSRYVLYVRLLSDGWHVD